MSSLRACQQARRGEDSRSEEGSRGGGKAQRGGDWADWVGQSLGGMDA